MQGNKGRERTDAGCGAGTAASGFVVAAPGLVAPSGGGGGGAVVIALKLGIFLPPRPNAEVPAGFATVAVTRRR